MFSNLTKLTKILTRNKFNATGSVGVQAVLRFLVGAKNLGQYTKLPYDKFAKKKRTFLSM